MKKFLFSLILFLIFATSSFAQKSVELQIQTGHDPDGDSLFIYIQVAKDSLFENLIWEWDVPCKPDSFYSVNFIANESGDYFWRAKSYDNLGCYGEWTKKIGHFIVDFNQPPTECFLVKPLDNEVIRVNL